jgi:hypothetical protein
MACLSNFDLNDILELLNSVREQQPESSKARDAIELAQIALAYTRHLRKEEDFARYYQQHFDPSYTLKVSHDFATRAEADQWLASGKAEDAERVRIEGKGFMVVRLPGRLSFMVAPLPEEMETDEGKEEES